MAKNRWELEEKRKQKALAAMQAALKSGAAYKGNAVQQTVSSPVNPKTAQSTLNTARSQSSTQRSSSGGGGGNPANTSGKTTTTRSNTLPGLEALPSFGSPTLRTPSASAQRQNYLSGASERRRTNVDSRTGRSRAMDERDLQLNMARWHNTTDEAERQRLNRENDAIRARLGLSYDPSTGVTYDARTGRNYSLPTQLLYGGTAAQRARAANQFPYSREAVGEDADSISMRPTMQQIAAGVGREASGVNAHRVMNDLFSRSAETWTDEDTRNRDAAVQALSDEMDRIMQQYGMRYSESGLGTGAWGMPDMVSDRTAIDRLREAGADETTIAYVQENIGLREAANRFGQGAEAVFKRAVGSPKAFVETVQQQAANVAESRENPEYVQLEEQERQLEAQLQSMNPQNYDGSVPQEYLDIYNQLQEVRERKNQLAVNTPTDQNLWGQTMLREAAEAQANATAGLSTVPRFLANQSISIAGNAPVMATSLIPGVGPAVGATLMGVQAAGQRAQELSAEGVAPSEALGRGIVSGVIEAVTEKLPIDALADILNRGGTDVVRNILRQMGIEATEESASYVMNFASDWAANDPNAEFSFAELAEQALGGAVSGGFFGTIGTAGGRARAGAQTAQETAEAPQAGNYPPVMQDAVQGDLGQNVSPSGFIVPEAKRRRMAAQDAEYAAQIDGVFNGSMPTDRVVSIGDTPDILLSIGATDLPMTMTQSTARKIAFPAGYMGGSHNLGIPALKRLPEQMRDPAAVLRSKTQPDSFVILTEWNDTNGNPVIIALHLDKQGVVDVTNEVASAYGKNNFAALTGENGENVLYTKNNKSIDQILDNRLQLPALLSDDTLVAYSIAQNSGEGKRQEAINEIDLTPATAIRRSTTDGHITMQSGLFNNSIAQNNGEGNRQEAINEIDLTQGDAMHQSLSGSGVQPRSGLSSNSISQTDGNSNPVQADSQAIGLRLAELDSAMRTAESLLPGPMRDARIAEIRAEMERVQAEAAIQEGLREPEPMQPENVDVPVSEAVQYGATPQQAMREAEVRAQGEAAQEARENAREEMLNRITYEKPPEINAQVRQAMNLAERVATRHKLRRADTRATPSDADRYINHESENAAVDLVNSLESERFFLRTLRKAWKLTKAELVNAEEIALGRGPVTEMNDHRYELVETYARALRNYWNDMRPAYDFYDELNAARTRRAEELIVDSDNWKDAKIGYQLSTRTPLRVLRKVMGDTEQMHAIYDAYFAPVIQHDAESVRWENNMRNRLRDIIKGLSHEDSVYIHLKNRVELNPKNETLQKLYADYVEKHQKKIHFAEADAAMEKLIEFTQDIHPQINETWVRNGIDPLEFRRRYLPSITPTKEGKWYNRILRGIGIETMADELPDEIAGRTENRRPGHQYASFAEERQGVNTEFDAFKAMDNYISNAATAIFHTDDIQNLRTLEETIRFKNADEGEQAELLAIMQNPSITIEDRVQQMSKIWEESQGNLPHFPSWIAEYTNLLAGKKARGDRQMESDLSRGMFRAMSDLEGKIAANMVGGNLSTALSNFIPLTQGAGELRYSSMARAMLDYTYDLLKKDSSFRDTSDFLTNRRGSDRIAKTRVQKASDLASIPVRAVDRMTSEVLTRARYIDNTKRGLNHQEALREADRWAAGLMGDRSKGAKPIVFDEKGPLKKAFTMFQLEVANQYDYLFGDIPANARAQGKGKAAVIATTAGALLQIFILSHLYNDAREKLTGTRGALDPIEIVNNFVGRATGYAMPNVFTMIQEAFAGELGIDDFQVEASESVWDNAKTTLQDVASNVPFLSGPVGALFGASNSRLPIQSVVPDIDSILSKSGAARTEAAIKELAKPIYGIVFPFGGTQAKKTVEGIATMLAGGSYVHDNDGNLKLQFPAYGESPLDWARAVVFGKWSSPEAQEYIDNGFKGLSADETAVFDQLRNNMGLDARQAMDTILSLRGFESVKDSEGNTVQTVKDQQRLALFDNENLTPEQKAAVDRALIVSGEDEQPADYSDRNAFLLGQYVSESRRDAARDAIATGLSIDQFVQWDDRLSELKNEKGTDDKAVRSAAEARQMTLDEILKDSMLSDSEKQALADTVVISTMSESQRDEWENMAKGKVNATDYVRFVDDIAAYKEEYKDTGADNSANVAEILRGYDSLTDEQHDVLFQTYSSTMKNNPFHVSEYEQRMQGNSFYDDLNEAGRAEVRALANEYEQAINEGKELSDWQGKAYMAEEAGISPETYILYRVALSATNTDGKGSAKQSEAETAVNLIPGLTQQQKAYLYQSTNTSWKNNPFGSATVTKYNAETTEAINPVEGGTLSSSFGPRSSPTAGASSWHKAIDIAASAGTPVKSVMPGTVVAVNKSGYGGGYGVSVRVDHGNGIITEYHHMQEGSADRINVGDTVEAGQQIGMVGSTGISTGPHLDMQAWKDGQIVDPLTIIPGYGEPSGYVYDGSVSSGVISSGAAQAAAAETSSGSSRQSTGLKSLKGFKRLPTF